MRFAFVNDNEIKKISEFENDDEAQLESHLYQAIVNIDGLDAQVGWAWDGKYHFYLKLAAITPRQIRLALVLSGVSLTDIDNSLNSLPEPTKSLALISWEYAVAFERNDPLVESVGLMLGMTSAQIDQLWMLAASL